jgi:hypothetical protein
VSADPSPARTIPPGWRWLLLGRAIPVVAIALAVKRHHHVWAAAMLAFGAGLGYRAIVLNGLTAAVVFAMALQKGAPTTVTAIMFTTNTTLSSLIGLAYLGDQARAGFAGPATAGFVLAITGAIGVAHDAARATSRRD